MRKLLAVFLLVLMVGCAGRQYITPTPEAQARLNSNVQAVNKCLPPPSPVPVFISDDESVNAAEEGDRIVITKGLSDFDDNTVRFVLAHEVAHKKLGHGNKRRAISIGTTILFVGAGFLVPGVGLLNHLVNPAVVGAFSKAQELDADREAAYAAVCMGMNRDEILYVLWILQRVSLNGGGLWSKHPPWSERIEHIKSLKGLPVAPDETLASAPDKPAQAKE